MALGAREIAPQIPSGNLKKLQLSNEGRAAFASGSVKRMVEADMRFHRLLYDLCSNPMIAETAALHWHHIRRLIGGYLQHYPMRNVWDEHQAILDAVMSGDPDRAEAAARHHANNAAEKFTMLLTRPSGTEEATPGRTARKRRKAHEAH